MLENPLSQMMDPKSIATVGAGNNPLKMGTIQALSILKDGYRGKFYPIHPTEKIILGHKAYSAVRDLPEAPELALLIVPAEQVALLMAEFGKIGTRRVIIITAGFKETGSDGLQAEERLKKIAQRYGIRFLGPNCMGIINSAVPLNVTVMPLTDQPGLLGMASQSGTYITQTLPYLKKRGIRLSKAVSVGNEGDINIIDALEYLGSDDQTKAIALYIEGLRDARRFVEVAQKITPHKPVVAQYVGGSNAGARAGAGHTGAMAGRDELYEGIFKQAGIIRVYSVEDLYSHGWTLATQPPLRGKRIAVLTNSGGPGTAIAHTCNAGGLDLPIFTKQLQNKIKSLLPPYAPCGNPVDMTFNLNTQTLSVTIPEIVMSSGEVDGLVLHGVMGRGFMRAVYPHVRELTGNLTEEQFLNRFSYNLSKITLLPWKYKLPMTISSFFDHEDNYIAAYQAGNIPVFDSPEKAARGMLALLRYQEVRERSEIIMPSLPRPSEQAGRLIKEAAARGQKNLDEYDSKKLLKAYGLPIASEKLVLSEAEAARAALSIGYPVVVKACHHALPHKTGRGLIYLDLKDESSVRRAYNSVQEAVGEDMPVLVAQMVYGNREFVAGIIRQPAFGPCVMFGLGGIFTEALKDVSFRIAPLSETEAIELVMDIRASELLGSVRGLPPANCAALAAILSKISAIPLLHPEIYELDINPILLNGASPVIVDALAVMS